MVRTLLQKEGINRRAGLPNWSSDVRQVGKVYGGVVYDTQGEKHDTRKVLPVPAASNGIIDVFRGATLPETIGAERRCCPSRSDSCS